MLLSFSILVTDREISMLFSFSMVVSLWHSIRFRDPSSPYSLLSQTIEVCPFDTNVRQTKNFHGIDSKAVFT